MTVSVRQILVQSGEEETAACLNLHSGYLGDYPSTPGDDYTARTLWEPTADPGTPDPSFITYALMPAEYRDISHVRCFALRFDPPFSGVRDARAWISPFENPPGWTFEVSINQSWKQHLQMFRPASDFFGPVHPNLMHGYDTRWELEAMTIEPYATCDGGPYYTNWVSLRATAYPDAEPGPAFGLDGDSLAVPMIWNFSWKEC